MTEAMGQAQMEMPRYVCHKKVWALKIEKIQRDEDGQGLMLIFEKKEYAPLTLTANKLLKKPDPQPGWYYVVYASKTNPGYFSFSPGAEFEDGYTLESELQEQTKIIF